MSRGEKRGVVMTAQLGTVSPPCNGNLAAISGIGFGTSGSAWPYSRHEIRSTSIARTRGLSGDSAAQLGPGNQ